MAVHFWALIEKSISCTPLRLQRRKEYCILAIAQNAARDWGHLAEEKGHSVALWPAMKKEILQVTRAGT